MPHPCFHALSCVAGPSDAPRPFAACLASIPFPIHWLLSPPFGADQACMPLVCAPRGAISRGSHSSRPTYSLSRVALMFNPGSVPYLMSIFSVIQSIAHVTCVQTHVASDLQCFGLALVCPDWADP